MTKKFGFGILGLAVVLGIGFTSSVFAEEAAQKKTINNDYGKREQMFEKAKEIGGSKLEEALKKAGYGSMKEMHDRMASEDGLKRMQIFMESYGYENMRTMHNAMHADPNLAGTGCH